MPSVGFPSLVQWIESGYAGQMHYFDSRRDAYRHPDAVLQGVRSLVMLAVPYAAAPNPPLPHGHGRIARYAWSGDDYHDVIHAKLKQLCQRIEAAWPDSRNRGVVDTAPLLEREVAQLAGLGWPGKNTLLLNKQQGSYFFLACLLTDQELPYDQPHHASHCGNCTACLDACPTDAFTQPGVLDARRCISYLTIEHRGPIDRELREPMGSWLFGCDVCQEVCPWNRKRTRAEATNNAPLVSVDAMELFSLTEETFRQRFRRTPLWRPRRRGILRNAAIVLGNQPNEESVVPLTRGLHDDEPVVRGAAAWALGRIGSPRAIAALESRQPLETDAEVSNEIAAALTAIRPEPGPR